MSRKISRRDFLSGSAAIGMSSAAALTKCSEARAVETGFATDFKPQEKCFMDQFYEGMVSIVRGIRETEIDTITRAMEKAYELKRKGGNIYSHVIYGHFPSMAGSPDRPGQPWLLPQCGLRPTQEEFDSMKKGDFLITNAIYKGTIDVRNRGVYLLTAISSSIKHHPVV